MTVIYVPDELRERLEEFRALAPFVEKETSAGLCVSLAQLLPVSDWIPPTGALVTISSEDGILEEETYVMHADQANDILYFSHWDKNRQEIVQGSYRLSQVRCVEL